MKKSFIPKSYRPNVPGSSIMEKDLALFKFPKKCETLSQSVVILSSKNDLVARNVWIKMADQNHAIHLFLDELGYTWDFTFSENNLSFFTNDGRIIPSSIYHRHPGIKKEHPFYSKHIALFEVMDIWKGNNIGQKRDHFQNTSKPFQAIHSILKSIDLKNDNIISIPKTYLIKGDFEQSQEKLEGNFIVKSCSSMRSIVATQKDYHKWDKKNLNNIPTLFQELIEGKDYRVHILDEKIWSLSVNSKDHIDYRYSSKTSLSYQAEDIPEEVKEFCMNIIKIEKNRLVGIDFIKHNDSFYCLECNPGPGWSTFNHPSKKEFCDFFSNKLESNFSKASPTISAIGKVKFNRFSKNCKQQFNHQRKI
jgi:hypothetical protein